LAQEMLLSSYLESLKIKIIKYVGVEAHPISAEELASMNYVTELKAENSRKF
jgi:hypothetical protein